VSALRADRTQAAAAALAAFAVYALSAPHTIGLEDDALFILSSYFLGIEHPPGYPLFTLAGQLFTWLPFGTIPYRVKIRGPSFINLSALPKMVEGHLLSDVIAVNASIDIVLGEIDR